MVGSPCPVSGSGGGVCHHQCQQNLVLGRTVPTGTSQCWDRITSSVSKAAERGTSDQSQGRRGEAHLVAEMSFSSTAGSKKDLCRD